MAALAKENLPADAPLRIGVKHKPDECEKKAQNGDKVKVCCHIHCTWISSKPFVTRSPL